MEIKIEQNVPIPNRAFYDDLVKMIRHDSFTFSESNYSNLRSSLQDVKKRFPNLRFRTIKISETERRIWRTR